MKLLKKSFLFLKNSTSPEPAFFDDDENEHTTTATTLHEWKLTTAVVVGLLEQTAESLSPLNLPLPSPSLSLSLLSQKCGRFDARLLQTKKSDRYRKRVRAPLP